MPAPSASSSRRVSITFQRQGAVLGRHDVELASGHAVVIGRSAAAAEIVVPWDSISRRHLSLALGADGVMEATDLGSGNGTFLHGQPLLPDQPRRFHASFNLALGDEIEACIDLGDVSSGTRAADDRPILADEHSQHLSTLLAKKSRVLIGRGVDCDIRLDDDLASRAHAAVTRAGGRTFIEDLGSGNGTFVDGRRIRSKTEIVTASHIFIGRHALGLSAAATDLARETAVLTHGLGIVFPGGGRGLHSTDIRIETGSMTAILGPSGCGKSTLVRALAGDLAPAEGTIEAFGIDLVKGYDYVRSIIGYVPQDDIVHPGLTVEQAVTFAARLRLEHLTKPEIREKVAQVLADLRISHIRHNLVSRISGGQRKRVSIAVELLSTPLILFLDEPTSPLDPQSVEEFLTILKDLAASGTTVVMVTHKPGDLAFMENAIFLAEGGHVVYAGPTAGHLGYFGASRTSEVYGHLAGNAKASWIQRYAMERRPAPAVAAARLKLKPARANPFKQWWWLTRRNFALKTNQPRSTIMLLAQAPVIAALICIIFPQISSAVAFLAVISAIWLGTNNSVREIVSERAIYKRERMFNLRLAPYVASKFCVLGTFAVIQAVMLVGVLVAGFAWRDSDPAWNQTATSMLWMAAVCLSATAMGLFLSASLDKTDKVMTIVPVVLIPQIMLAGSLTRITNWFVEILSYATLSRWSNEGLTILQEEVRLRDPVILPTGQTLEKTDAHALLLKNLGDRSETLFGDFSSTLALDAVALAMLCASFIALTFYKLAKIH